MHLTRAGQQRQDVTAATAFLPAGTACPGLSVVCLLHCLRHRTVCMLLMPAHQFAWLWNVQCVGQNKGQNYI